MSGEERRLMVLGRLFDTLPTALRDWLEIGIAVLPSLRGCAVCGGASGFVCAQLVPGGGAVTVQLLCEAHSTRHDPEWRERVEGMPN